jgi:hypothetical protein
VGLPDGYYLILGAYSPAGDGSLRYARHLSSVGFIYLGFVLANREQSLLSAIVIFVVGLMMQILEAYYLSQFISNKEMFKFQFLIGTLLMAIGAFHISKNIETPHCLAILGARRALIIYLIHPYFIFLFQKLNIVQTIESALIIPFTFLTSLIFSILLFNWMPKIYYALNGDLSRLRSPK